MDNFIQSYLIRLGFSPDEASFRNMSATLAAADRVVGSHAMGMAKSMVEAQISILGVFTAVSGAIVGIADKVAMADQGYRLMGLRMLMTTESARKMDMVTKTLGADIGTIFWDPELRERAGLLSDHIDRLTEKLGPRFTANMKGIRDIRAEFGLLDVELKFLGMSFVSDRKSVV